MQHVKLILNVDAERPPLAGVSPDKIYRIQEGVTIARLPGGVASGRSSVGIIFQLPDGKHVLLELTMRIFTTAATAFEAADQAAKS